MMRSRPSPRREGGHERRSGTGTDVTRVESSLKVAIFGDCTSGNALHQRIGVVETASIEQYDPASTAALIRLDPVEIATAGKALSLGIAPVPVYHVVAGCHQVVDQCCHLPAIQIEDGQTNALMLRQRVFDRGMCMHGVGPAREQSWPRREAAILSDSYGPEVAPPDMDIIDVGSWLGNGVVGTEVETDTHAGARMLCQV